MSVSTMPYEVEDMQPTAADMTETDRLLLEQGPTKLECPSNDCPLLHLTHSMEGKVYLVTCALGEHFTQDGPCPFPPAKVVAALDDLALEVRNRRALVTQHMEEARRYEELRKEVAE